MMRRLRKVWLRYQLGRAISELELMELTIAKAARCIDRLTREQGNLRMELALLEMSRPPISRTFHPAGGAGPVRIVKREKSE